ncbi:hypothetical protein TorRG33x02_139900 [Trema orientale]|uniref:Uncharacterized protein n=1 Tax=Trema orientale TaxID=63057 RepID=A0A2P5EXT5_TREOI|nr:hypothetical protein TorRG33x02_139900 [Trema orientale]
MHPSSTTLPSPLCSSLSLLPSPDHLQLQT